MEDAQEVVSRRIDGAYWFINKTNMLICMFVGLLVVDCIGVSLSAYWQDSMYIVMLVSATFSFGITILGCLCLAFINIKLAERALRYFR